MACKFCQSVRNTIVSFTNPRPVGPAPTISDWLSNPTIGYHNASGVTFGSYSPVMPMPLPPYGGPHPQARVNKSVSPVGQNLYDLYANPTSQYNRNLIGQR